MKKPLLVLFAGFVFMTGCVSERKSDTKGLPPVAAQKENTNGLDFLTDIPSLSDVSLNMSVAKLLEIVRQQKLDYSQESVNGQTTYPVRPKEYVVVLFGFRQGKCSGIQRMRD